jgi:hypothetical protein
MIALDSLLVPKAAISVIAHRRSLLRTKQA